MNLQAGTEAANMEQHGLRFVTMAFLVNFLISPRTTHQGVAPPAVGWALHNQEDGPQKCPKSNPIKQFLVEVLLSQEL